MWLGFGPGVRERPERGALRRAGGVDVTSLCRSHLQNACMTHTLLRNCHGGRARERERGVCVKKRDDERRQTSWGEKNDIGKRKT